VGSNGDGVEPDGFHVAGLGEFLGNSSGWGSLIRILTIHGVEEGAYAAQVLLPVCIMVRACWGSDQYPC